MEKGLNILFLADGIHPFSIGGMQKYSSELVAGLLKAGCKITLVFSVEAHKEMPSFEQVLEKLEIPPERVPLFSMKCIRFPAAGRFPGHYIRESYDFSKLIFEEVKMSFQKFDFIYAQGFCAWYILEQKKKGLRIPPVGVHFHGLNMFQKSFGFKSKLIALMFRKPVKKNLLMADVIFSYGGVFNKIYSELGVAEKCIFQPIGIRESSISLTVKAAHFPLKLIFIGRNDRVKGLDLYHKVIDSLPVGKFHFTFVGNIPLNRRLNRVDCFYTGVISDNELNQHLEGSDVLVCPSYSEGMPYVILEAMSNGLMILATNVGAISEMIDPSNSILISPGNLSELKNSLLKLGELKLEDINACKQKSLVLTRKFIWDKVIADFLIELNKKWYH